MNNLTVGSRIIRLAETKSTNDFARKLIDQSKTVFDGTTVVVDNQIAGKGQVGKIWFSEIGNSLCFSTILHPKHLNASDYFQVSKMTSLALIDFLESLGLKGASIKWPNDIYIGQRKVAGILIENIIKGSKIHCSIIGVGLNINQLEFPDDLPNPVSLKMISGHHYDLKTSLSDVLSYLDKRYLQLNNFNKDHLSNAYHNNLYLLNEYSFFRKNGKELKAVIKGVATNGQLMLELEDGKTQCHNLNEIEFIQKP